MYLVVSSDIGYLFTWTEVSPLHRQTYTVHIKRNVSKNVQFRFVNRAVSLPLVTVMPLDFKAVSFRAISCQSTDAESNCREGKNRKAKINIGERSRTPKVGGEWQSVATVQLEALKAITIFKASVQPHKLMLIPPQ